MKLLITDVETTETNESGMVCEIAATLYHIGDCASETGAIASVSTLIPVPENPCQFINNIPQALTQKSPSTSASAINLIGHMAFLADYAVAFNAEFDSPFVDKLLGEQQWLCAMKDFDWGYPKTNAYNSFKLTDLALWLGIGVSTVHRAGDDVRLLTECFNRRRDNLQAMVRQAVVRANSPVVELKALVSYENRGLASKAGFRWDDKRRIWARKMKEWEAAELLPSLEFETEVI